MKMQTAQRTVRIDAHVHGFPDRLALAVRARLNERGGLSAGPLLCDVAEAVKAGGFDAAWLLPYAHRAGVSASINEWSASETKLYPWMVAGATFHPDDPDMEWLVERALVELHLRVVKLHCSVGNFAATNVRLDPVWAVCGELGVPVVIHAGRLNPGETEEDEIDSLRVVLSRFPRAPIVLAHTGFPNAEAALRLMEEFDNLYADVTPVWDRPNGVGAAEIDRFAGRLLFGSDAPNNPRPATEQVSAWAEMDASEEGLAQLLGGAAARLIPLSQPV